MWALLKGEYRKTAHQILEVAKSKEKLTEAAMTKIKHIAGSFDQDDMRKMARANYSNMAKTLQGYMV